MIIGLESQFLVFLEWPLKTGFTLIETHYLLVSSAVNLANSLEPDQARQNVGLDLDPICLTLTWHSRKNFLKKLILKKISSRRKSMGLRGK